MKRNQPVESTIDPSIQFRKYTYDLGNCNVPLYLTRDLTKVAILKDSILQLLDITSLIDEMYDNINIVNHALSTRFVGTEARGELNDINTYCYLSEPEEGVVNVLEYIEDRREKRGYTLRLNSISAYAYESKPDGLHELSQETKQFMLQEEETYQELLKTVSIFGDALDKQDRAIINKHGTVVEYIQNSMTIALNQLDAKAYVKFKSKAGVLNITPKENIRFISSNICAYSFFSNPEICIDTTRVETNSLLEVAKMTTKNIEEPEITEMSITHEQCLALLRAPNHLFIQLLRKSGSLHIRVDNGVGITVIVTGLFEISTEKSVRNPVNSIGILSKDGSIEILNSKSLASTPQRAKLFKLRPEVLNTGNKGFHEVELVTDKGKPLGRAVDLEENKLYTVLEAHILNNYIAATQEAEKLMKEQEC